MYKLSVKGNSKYINHTFILLPTPWPFLAFSISDPRLLFTVCQNDFQFTKHFAHHLYWLFNLMVVDFYLFYQILSFYFQTFSFFIYNTRTLSYLLFDQEWTLRNPIDINFHFSLRCYVSFRTRLNAAPSLIQHRSFPI